MKKLTMIFAALAMGVVLVGCQQPAEGDPGVTSDPNKPAPTATGVGGVGGPGEKPADDGHNHKPGEGH